MTRQYYVYIMTNPRKTVLYTGVTNELVFYEVFRDSYNAIAREKQIKAGSHRRKFELIERMNPGWRNLYDEL